MRFVAMLLVVLGLGLAVTACSTTTAPTAVAPAVETPAAAAAVDQPTVPPVAQDIPLGAGAVTTASGLKYEDTAVGEGAEVARCDFVSVHYTGWLADGTQFDSSVERGTPFQFAVGADEVIKGWDEGVTGMKAGGKRTLVIPPELAYGANGSGPIPPNSTLKFDVELLDTQPRPALPEAPETVDTYETTESGLQYAVLAPGEGAEAKSGDQVAVHYTGWLEDGTLFDSSLNPDRCGPIRFPLGSGRVIKGWDEGVAGMKVGERRQLRIPPDLAYGAEGSGPIPAAATLIFDVELLAAEPGQPGQ